jgi:NADPH-dependent ferric siderophore reductase
VGTPESILRRTPLAKAFVSCEVIEVDQVGTSARRVRLAGPALTDLAWTPGQHIRLHVQSMFSARTWLGNPKDALRTYTVWDRDPEAGTISLRMHDHGGDGPGVRWARAVVPGQSATVVAPYGDFVLRTAPYHVFAGDDTAAAAIAAMTRALQGQEPTYGVLETTSADDEVGLARSGGGIERVGRPGPSSSPSPALLDAFRDLELPDTPGAAYLAGEARTCQALRDHLVRDRGWPRAAVKVKPFWAPGKRGLD